MYEFEQLGYTCPRHLTLSLRATFAYDFFLFSSKISSQTNLGIALIKTYSNQIWREWKLPNKQKKWNFMKCLQSTKFFRTYFLLSFRFFEVLHEISHVIIEVCSVRCTVSFQQCKDPRRPTYHVLLWPSVILQLQCSFPPRVFFIWISPNTHLCKLKKKIPIWDRTVFFKNLNNSWRTISNKS